jgi:MoaA/NifB/PqqE/SkfB family radical SAM enzyme
MYKYDEIKTVHLEITDKCNASCLMCGRNWYGGALNRNLPLTEMSLQDIKNIFPNDLIRQLNRMYLCGNYGDSIMAKDTLPILNHFREINPNISLGMHSNASGRNREWWYNLGNVLNKESDYCRFSIDGLEDTNHLYRKNTNWDKIIESAQSFISGGGRAIWEFIVFRHNQHQIDEAQALAKKLGFKEFQVIKTGRFYSGTSGKIGWDNAYPSYSKKGDFEYYIQPPSDDKYVAEDHQSSHKEEVLFEMHVKIQNYPQCKIESWKPKKVWNIRRPWRARHIEREYYFDNKNISCKALGEKSIYVNPEGYVTPCCWTGYAIYSDRKTTYLDQMRGLIADVGLENLNAKSNSIESIVNGDWFQSTFPKGWDSKDPEKGKILICAKYCGEKYSTTKSEYDIEPVSLS